MDAKTLKALKSSIEHWEANARAESVDDASARDVDCALCAAFDHCIGCPVAKTTGASGCERTPYHAAYNALRTWREMRDGDSRNAFHVAAQAEVAFLKSLLPTEEGL